MLTRVRFHWWCLLLLALASVVFLSFLLDSSVQAWVAHHRDLGTARIMRSVSRFGDWPAHIALGLVLIGLAWWRQSKKWMRIATSMILACALAGAVARIVKISAGRPRPSIPIETSWAGPSLSSRYNSFPSGHTAASTAFFASLAFASWRIGLPLLVIPVVVAFSRIYVAAHHLSDVVCAAIIGLLAAYVVKRWIPPTIQGQESNTPN